MMCIIGLCLASLVSPPEIPAPDQSRILSKGVRFFEMLRIVACPNLSQLAGESRYSALSGDASAREKGDRVSSAQAVSRSLYIAHAAY